MPDADATRKHHYDFAHRALPAIAFSHPDRLLGDLEVDALGTFRGIWRFVGTKVQASGALPLTDGPVEAQRVDTDAGAAWIARLPLPRATTEAAFVAVVRGAPEGEPDDRIAVFTLEFGRDPVSEKPYHVVCRWKSDSTHLNSGRHIGPNVDEFAAAIAGWLGEQQAG
jgi:hypothetical protein